MCLSYVCELSTHDVKFDLGATDDVSGQVKARMFDFSGLVTSASYRRTIDVKRKQSQ